MEPVEAQSNGLDERMALLKQHPILYKHVKAALEARSIKRLEFEILRESVPKEMPRSSQNLPALDGISAMLILYQETVRLLLDQSDHPEVSAEELEFFKSQFRTSAFTCRLKSCPRATLGFELERFLLEHERTHLRRFRCTFPDCKYPSFSSAQALRGHVDKYHSPNPAPKSIRDIWVSPTARRAPTSRDEDNNKSKPQVQKKTN
ncbi:hypothetical protein ACHAQJ_006601 [Trichoderma viride]